MKIIIIEETNKPITKNNAIPLVIHTLAVSLLLEPDIFVIIAGDIPAVESINQEFILNKTE
ncbi:hypothetical protein CPA52_14050 [Pseudoalteromonas marina]|nr:hypothetical protein CPA52_14050 [Pseudoalteromonas marina]